MKSEKTNIKFLSEIKKTVLSKQFILFALVLVILAVPTFAASSGDTIEQLDSWGQKILSLLSSTWVRVLILCALVVEAIGMVMSGKNGAGGGAILQRFGPWVAGTLVLLCANGITEYFFSDFSLEVSCLFTTIDLALC